MDRRLALLAIVAGLGVAAYLLLDERSPDAPLVRPEPRTELRTDTSREAAALAVAVPLIARWEGLRTEAYLDRIASPPVWTVCYGETKGVGPGDSYTEAECRAMLAREVAEYRDGLHRYFTAETRARRLTPERDAAYTSLAYNVGIAGAGRSTATKRLNDGDIRGGCKALTWWNRAGNRVVRGLVNRRADEYALCMQGVA